MPDEFNLEMTDWRAVHRLYPQAIPPAFGIQKYDRAPCVRACPANLRGQGYVQLIKAGKFQEALALIMERLPLPGTIARICPHPCEDDCRRQEIDEPVAICALKRFVADQVDWETLPVPEVDKRDEQVAIVGAGPAGLTCAYHLALMGYRPVIFEAAPEAGGWLRFGIPGYRLPQNILEQEVAYIQKLGVEIRYNSPIGKGRTISDLLTRDGFRAVFLGVGCQESIRLSVPGVEAEGVRWGGEFLKDSASGKSLQLQGKKVVVIGGGNVALDVARTAMRRGAARVTVICLENYFEMPALPWEVEEAQQEGTDIIFRWGVKQILTEGGKVTGIEMKAVTRVFDEEGRFAPVYDEELTFTQDCDVVSLAIGQKANLKFLTPEDGVELTPRGLIKSDPDTLATSRPGVFAGGDVVSGPFIAIAAVAAGRQAAESIDRYLKGMDLKEGRELPLRPVKEGNWNPISKDQSRQARVATPIMPIEEWGKDFNEIHLGFTEEQAMSEAARCLSCGGCSECMQCVTACLPGAVDHGQQPESMHLEVGAVILAPGSQTFDPAGYESYHYARFPNVVTSLEFERILSAGGPFQGHMVRPSDHQEPQKIAWLQCVGSRDLHHGDHRYCSAVCCMYAIKQAVMAQEHRKGPLEAAVFFMDLRTHGKDFEKYAQRAAERGVRFIRSRVHSVDEMPGTHDLTLRYLSEDGVLRNETFDLVVLSVGLEVSPEALKLADNLGIALKPETRFADTTPFAPISANKPGIFVCGAFQGPKDIPQSVMEASAAAAAASELLSTARYSLLREKPEIPERDIAGEEPKIGVFVCNCGTNIAGVIDVPALRDYAKTLTQVEAAESFLFACSQDSQATAKVRIKELGLNRVVVASCSPRTHEFVFQEALKEAGLNPYLLEMANIRDHDAWVHMAEPETALAKAKDLVRMAVSRAANLDPLYKQKFPVIQAALIIGGGVAGLEAARSLGNMGFQSYLVEKSDRLGGNAWNLVVSSRGYNYRGYLEELIQTVENHDHVDVLINSQVKDTGGFIGNFRTTIATPGGDQEVEHGVTILATGGVAFGPQEYLYGQHPNVLLALELDQALAQKDARVVKARQAVFIQCVGSREPERPYCSRLCCTHSVESALALKEMNPDLDVFILYRDLRTYGDKELLYQEAREKGVMFIRYDPEAKPRVVKTAAGGLEVIVQDRILERPLVLRPDLITLASAIIPNPTGQLGELFKVPSNPEGFFNEVHAKLRPVDCVTEGVFLAGLVHYPKPLDESVAQAKAAAARAATILARDQVEVDPLVSVVDPDLCMGCGLCEITCSFGAMHLIQVPGKGYRAENQPAYCKGCGSCAAGCPQRAIDMLHFRDRQIKAAIHAGGRG
jgi:heterodisulfide reductase subunit A-like polyferredoxin